MQTMWKSSRESRSVKRPLAGPLAYTSILASEGTLSRETVRCVAQKSFVTVHWDHRAVLGRPRTTAPQTA